jgi:hypothetical protein
MEEMLNKIENEPEEEKKDYEWCWGVFFIFGFVLLALIGFIR